MRTIGTKRHKRLIELLIEQRKSKGIRQDRLAAALGHPQAWTSRLESGQRRVDVIEFLALAEIIGFNPFALLGILQAIPSDYSPLPPSEPAPPRRARKSKAKPARRRRR